MNPKKNYNCFRLNDAYLETLGPPVAVSHPIKKNGKEKLNDLTVICNTVFFRNKVNEEINQKVPLSFSDFKLER